MTQYCPSSGSKWFACLQLVGAVLLCLGSLISADAAKADGYKTARGLYHDCSEGFQARLDADRANMLRKCQNFIGSVAADWLRGLPLPDSIENPRLCLAMDQFDIEQYIGATEYIGQADPFLAYWDARGLSFVDGWTTSARAAVLEFLGAKIGICEEVSSFGSSSLLGPVYLPKGL
jgi:hypothetical protein